MEKVLSIKAGGLIAGGVIGALIGVLASGGKQMVDLHLKPELLLDPPCPNVESLDSTMVEVFRSFMGAFYRMCPKESKEEYKKTVQDAMQFSEEILTIEAEIMNKIREPSFKQRTKSAALYKLCMQKIREVRRFFYTEILEQLTAKIDHLGILLADHLTNIRNITSF